MRNEQWIFYENFPVFDQMETTKGFEWIKFVRRHLHQIQETELVDISKLNCVWIHGSLRMQECRDESESYNYQQIQLSNNKLINGILGGTLDLAWL